MIDERFSAEKFLECEPESDAMTSLVNDLSDTVTRDLHEGVSNVFRNIVGQLNAIGHRLRIEELNNGSISYRDDEENQDGYRCKLRLAVDIVVSAGYSDIVEDT